MITNSENPKLPPSSNDHALQVEQLAASLADDPLKFIAICWPDMQIYEKQREILLSVHDNIETFVYAANETGKTRTAALVALWFFLTRQPARVITSSSSETQLDAILWNEIRHLVFTSKFPLPLAVNYLSIKKRRAAEIEVLPLDYTLGHVSNKIENFQGHHLPNDKPRVLAVFDESSGVPDEFFEAADSWAHRKLVIGNPLSNNNFFYRLCKQGDVLDPAGGPGLLRKVIHVDGIDSPNVQLGIKWKEAGRQGSPPIVIPGLLTYEDYIRREQTYDEVQRTTRLHGHFYEGDQAMLFPATWLESAMDRRRWAELQQQSRRVQAIGVDVAAGGRDNTCWTLVDRYGVIEQIVLNLSNTMEIAGRTLALLREHGLSSYHVAMDAGGGGKQIADRLSEQGQPVSLVGFGESADGKQTYKNRRAELYGLLRERLKPDRDQGQFLLPPDAHELRQELSILPLCYDSEGRLMLPPKSRSSARPGEVSIEKLLGRSPDRADSLALAVWVLDRHAGRPDFSDHVFWDEDDNTPLSPEEVEAMPEELRGIYDLYGEMEHERKQRQRWGDDYW
jgi:hypothetical protein